ncbi:Laccase-2 [Pseudocercospora fuligena]|uniref:laccase n=1 Tax=Pseudocercospora fuligena TaxID=685502 RepID=A0A8H6RPB5_9PEZI|nr:Laccase-2 [Pseudocercospora fuligena]
MMHCSQAFGLLFLFASVIEAAVKPTIPLSPSGRTPALLSKRANASCFGNTADDRSTWCDYDINTDYYLEGPDTGKTVEYWFELQNVTIAPDGTARQALTVNGSIPGPTIIADWGDTVVIHLTNSLTNNGSSLHFHGIRQNWTNSNDGVASITQCPTTPGDSVTYNWEATQYGTSWYHSHYSLQAWEGVFGGIKINGPTSANYDEDMGVLFVQDWTHDTADSLYSYAEVNGPATQDTGLINGTNISSDEEEGFRWNTTVESGKSYKIGLINPSIDSFFDVSIDNHTLTIVSADFVPITPYTTDVIGLGPGQRYEVIITADQSSVASDFWLRAVPDTFCSSTNDMTDNIMGIIHYGDSTGTPTTSPWTTDSSYLNCQDPPIASLVPIVAKNAGASADLQATRNVTVQQVTGTNVFKWYMNNITFLSEYYDPTSLQVVNGNTTYSTQEAVINLPTPNDWMYLIIQETNTAPHPIHLHGHDFYILASGSGTFNSSIALQTTNPPRQDVAMLPSAGYLVLAFQADNPGIWLMHCHIGWHTSEGFALQFVERYDEIAALYDKEELTDACDTWRDFEETGQVVQYDSGI